MKITIIIKKNILFFLLFICFTTIKSQSPIQTYHSTFNLIDSMLIGSIPLDFKKSVIESENAYQNGTINQKELNCEIESLKELVNAFFKNNPIEYSQLDKDIVGKHAALFKVMTDTLPINTKTSTIFSPPLYTYDFDDMWGEKDWSKMFVSKLLATGKGNCHSLPYLYKILAEEMGIPAYLAFAPNHIYIKSFSEKTGWYNTELTSGTFPIDAWIIASGYVTVEAIQNGLYMDTLSTKQSVANCLVDLAQGYQHKFGKDNPDFVVKCCNTCLKYHPTNVNAMLTKAEAQKYYIQVQMKVKNKKTPQELFSDNSIKEMYEDMEQTYVKLHQLGYRRMPKEMYMQWMGALKNEPNKYINTKVASSKKKK